MIGLIGVIVSIVMYPLADAMLAPSTLDIPPEYSARTTGKVKEFSSVSGTYHFDGGGVAPGPARIAVVSYQVDATIYETYDGLGDTFGIGAKVGVAYKPESPKDARCYLIHTTSKLVLAILCVFVGLIGLATAAYGFNRIVRARST